MSSGGRLLAASLLRCGSSSAWDPISYLICIMHCCVPLSCRRRGRSPAAACEQEAILLSRSCVEERHSEATPKGGRAARAPSLCWDQRRRRKRGEQCKHASAYGMNGSLGLGIILRGWVIYRSELSGICHACDSLPKSGRQRERATSLSPASQQRATINAFLIFLMCCEQKTLSNRAAAERACCTLRATPDVCVRVCAVQVTFLFNIETAVCGDSLSGIDPFSLTHSLQ